MPRLVLKVCLASVLGAVLVLGGCGTETTSDVSSSASGSLALDVAVASDLVVDEVTYTITGNAMPAMEGTIDTTAPGSTASVEVFGIPAGEGYVIVLSATSQEEAVTCEGDAPFDIVAGEVTEVYVMLRCQGEANRGSVRADGTFNFCAQLTNVVVSSLEASAGSSIDVQAEATDQEGDSAAFRWTSEGGAFADPSSPETTFTCGDVLEETVTVQISDDDFGACIDGWSVDVRCAQGGGDLCQGVDCNDGNACTDDICEASTGVCENEPVEDGTPCSGGTCVDGACETESAGWVVQIPLPGGSLRDVSFSDVNTGTAVSSGGIILRTTDGGAIWTVQESGTTNGLNGVSSPDADTGTAVGDGGTILRTTDGGQTWIAQVSGTGQSLRGVSFTGASTGTAVGDGGTILRTIDGGETWVAQQTGTTDALNGVSFTDASTGTAVGDGGTILRTTDGGQTWVAQQTGTTSALRSVSFTDANTGTVVGDITLRTTDGGQTWVQQVSGAGALFAVSFANALTGTAVGPFGKIYQTEDGGRNWTKVSGPGAPDGFTQQGEDLLGVSTPNPLTTIVVGSSRAIYRTADGGATWSSPANRVRTLRAVSFTDARNGTAVGDFGAIVRTTDGGQTWVAQVSGTTEELRGVAFTDANTGTAVGDGNPNPFRPQFEREAVILRTTDGGQTWMKQDSGTTAPLRSVFFSDANTGTAVGVSATILRTTDGGTTWRKQDAPQGAGGFLWDVCFSDANAGTIVGARGTILTTTDGGETWDLQTVVSGNGFLEELRGVSCPDARTRSVVGDAGTIFHTTDGGQTWVLQDSPVPGSLYSVAFADANTGTAVGFGFSPTGGLILRTTDGGDTWVRQDSGTPFVLFGVSLTDADTGTAVGGFTIPFQDPGINGVILRTTDGGG